MIDHCYCKACVQYIYPHMVSTFYVRNTQKNILKYVSCKLAAFQRMTRNEAIEVFHTRDQNHVTAGAAPFWGSRFATAAVAAVYMLYKLAANLAAMCK